MLPGIWTAMELGDGDAVEAICALAGDGWRHFEIASEHLIAIDEAEEPPRRIEAIRQALAELGATMPQGHARLRADVAAQDEAIRRRDIEELGRHIGYCAGLGITNVVIHPGKGAGHADERERQLIIRRNVDAFGSLADQAGEAGMKIALENFEWVGRDEDGRPRRFGYVAEEMVELVEAIGRPNVGVCIDTSHANLQKHKEMSVGDIIRVLGRYICATHISDNRGDRDAHLIPGDGGIDWPDVMAAFAEIGYEGIFNLEIPGGKHALAELRRLKSRHALRVTEWLLALNA